MVQYVRDNFGRATVVHTSGTLESPEQKCATGHYQELAPTGGDNNSARGGRCISIIVFGTDFNSFGVFYFGFIIEKNSV